MTGRDVTWAGRVVSIWQSSDWRTGAVLPSGELAL